MKVKPGQVLCPVCRRPFHAEGLQAHISAKHAKSQRAKMREHKTRDMAATIMTSAKFK